MKKIIVIFGHGYVSKFLSKVLSNSGWIVYCTSRQPELNNFDDTNNVKIIKFLDRDLYQVLKVADAILSTVPPDHHIIDHVLRQYIEPISQEKFQWVGYLSSTGVYGHHDGAWVDEETKCQPTNEQSQARLLAEEQWMSLHKDYHLPVHIFRLSGIYGPGRNCLEDIINGKDFTIIKEDQYFSRIHIEDICQGVVASINLPTPGEIYNLSDDEPSRIDVVQQFGASILKRNPLREIAFEEAYLSERAKMFFYDSKKVSNRKILHKLNITWKYPNYRDGLLHGCLPYL